MTEKKIEVAAGKIAEEMTTEEVEKMTEEVITDETEETIK